MGALHDVEVSSVVNVQENARRFRQEHEGPIYVINHVTGPDVECELITPTKEEREVYGYEVLSLCWDTEQKTRYVYIHQRGRICVRYISPNLHSALRALRHIADYRFLWIDAI